MERRELGRTGIEVSPVGLGTLQFGSRGLTTGFYPALPPERIAEIVRAAVEGGIDWFDTAEMYGRGESERLLASSLTEAGVRPGDVVIASKWTPWLRTARSISRTIDARLRALAPFPLDLHQIHMPHGSFSRIESQVEQLAQLREAGRIGAVGVSNFSAAHMERAHDVLRRHGLRLAANQVQINLLARDIETDGVLETAERLGVTLIALAPLRTGLLTGKFHERPELLRNVPRVRRLMAAYTPKTFAATTPLIDTMREIASAHGATVSQVAIAWILQRYGTRVVVIPGASKVHHAQESAAAMSLELTAREMTALDERSSAAIARL
ncbi:aldo/keto reductase [Prauserella flavalba]|uniref:aldo/keto reductase n=1 Tax=Prauserella flavalba TaxID=1477506 RepID=UPI0036E852F8